jgi:hypothetical protein
VLSAGVLFFFLDLEKSRVEQAEFLDMEEKARKGLVEKGHLRRRKE